MTKLLEGGPYMKTSLKWLTVAMPLIERLERDYGETRKRLEREKREILID